MKMCNLLFKNPVFKEGLNLTCRKGTKWSGFSGRATLIETDGDAVGMATIVNTKVLRLMDVTEEDLAEEHDPSCRTWQGLYNELKRVYGDIDKRELITLVYFEPMAYKRKTDSIQHIRV